MSYTVEKRYVVDTDIDGRAIYTKEVVKDLVGPISIGMIDLHYDKGLDRIKIKKLDDFGQVIKEKIYFVGDVHPAKSIIKNSDVYKLLYEYYKRDPFFDVLDNNDIIVLTKKRTFNIVSNDDVVRGETKLIDIKEIGENNKYQKDGLSPM